MTDCSVERSQYNAAQKSALSLVIVFGVIRRVATFEFSQPFQRLEASRENLRRVATLEPRRGRSRSFTRRYATRIYLS
ncbi:MAG TPA: hypothetical protein VI306_16100 [Pyrinomonadaceae bacterium]